MLTAIRIGNFKAFAELQWIAAEFFEAIKEPFAEMKVQEKYPEAKL